MFKYVVDENNSKALSVVTLLLFALDNGCDNVNVVTSIEMIRDYLVDNEKIFIEHL